MRCRSFLCILIKLSPRLKGSFIVSFYRDLVMELPYLRKYVELSTVSLFLLLLTGTICGQPLPFVPFRLETQEFHRHVERAQKEALYVVQSSPAPRSVLRSEEGLELIITFSKPLDPSSIPPLSKDWSLLTPMGTITSENLGQYGRATYYSELSIVGSERANHPKDQSMTRPSVIPPNSVVFQLPQLKLAEGEYHRCRLVMAPRKLDRLYAEEESPQTEVDWSFRVESPKLPALEGRAALTFEEKATSWADLRPFSALALLRGELDNERLRLVVVDGPLPNIQPYRERRLVLDVPLERTLGSELKLEWKKGSVVYSERDYEPSEPPQRPVPPNASRVWQAEEGTALLIGPDPKDERISPRNVKSLPTSVTGENGKHRLFLDLNFVPYDSNTEGALRLRGEVEFTL